MINKTKKIMNRINHLWQHLWHDDGVGVGDTGKGLGVQLGPLPQMVLVVLVNIVETETVGHEVVIDELIDPEVIDPEVVDPEGQRVQVPQEFVLLVLPLILPLALEDDEVVGHEETVVVDTLVLVETVGEQRVCTHIGIVQS